jgi:hypothetical protein
MQWKRIKKDFSSTYSEAVEKVVPAEYVMLQVGSVFDLPLSYTGITGLKPEGRVSTAPFCVTDTTMSGRAAQRCMAPERT